MANTSRKEAQRYVAQNRKARHDYHIEEAIEAGLVLTGSEVKSLRESGASLADAYASVEGGELWLKNAHIPEYKNAAYNNHEPRRARKLLVRKSELGKLAERIERSGYTLVPLSLYFGERGYAKVQLALARGKKHHDRREDITEREVRREMDRALKRRSRE
jgi:SsrA-binding protein